MPEMVELLLKHKADLHAREEDGWGALHFAAHNAGLHGSAATVLAAFYGCGLTRHQVKLLLDAGIDTQLRVSVHAVISHARSLSRCYRSGMQRKRRI